ncbi:hypothetical protein K2173_015587 [Erythroxylum novogranatense]|uniref:Nucleolar complex protein 3 homolog n=1 Tax=Erythroxylum novogranatense TaxID=1862640 RepID=A0AAV8SE34_9ROSI|nr:hypothetical protein K2173_015587 [Erythroxylum novogranatense]
MVKKNKKQKVILPPALPAEISEDEIEVSDEDLEFVHENLDYAAFVSRLDTQSITKHVSRVAGLEGDDALEASYEKRKNKKENNEKVEEENKLYVDPVDTLPVKTLDGQLYYRTSAVSGTVENIEKDKIGRDEKDTSMRLTKAERRAKLKKNKKEAKKLKDLDIPQDQKEQAPQAAVLAEVKEELSAEEAFKRKKLKLAELGMELLTDPESNIKSLKEMLHICKDDDPTVVILGLLSLLAVFKDIIPGYRIRVPTEKELEMKVSKEVKKMRYYESTLLSVYKAYLQTLIRLEKQPKFQHVAVRCICTLLESVPHFNFRESLLSAVVQSVGSPDDVIRKLCCTTIKSLFIDEGKHGGEAILEAVRLIADNVKALHCQLHPDSVEVFMSLAFDEDLGKAEEGYHNNKVRNRKHRKRKHAEESSQLQDNDRKRSRQEMMTKIREEVSADYKAACFTLDVAERRRIQAETLSAVFETYFRILKLSMQSTSASSETDGNSVAGVFGAHPLLTPCLNGLGKFSHLIDLDYIGDLMNYLKKLASGGDSSDSSEKCLTRLTVSERLQCCIAAFKVMRSNLDALNVDLQDFFVHLYNIILEYRPGRDKGELLAEAFRIMLYEDRQHDMQKAAAFVKRLATFSLCFGSAESMAALVTLKHLVQKNVKCRNLLENDSGGGSISGSVAKYQPYASDPNLSGALSSVLWELNLLSKHYHPAVATISTGILNMINGNNQVLLSTLSPQQAFMEFSLGQRVFNPTYYAKKSSSKKNRESGRLKLKNIEQFLGEIKSFDEDELQAKLSNHFMLLHDIKEHERLRLELDRTNLALQLHEDYEKQKRKARKV